MFKIEPVEKYSTDYHECVKQAKKHIAEDARPDFQDTLGSIYAYDTIYLGYPNYCHTMPMHVWTFIEKYNNLKGKVIRPFCTHGGGALGESIDELKALCPEAKIEKPIAIDGSLVKESEDDIKNGYKKGCELTNDNFRSK
ncbi:MAG: flavodoxin [Clostridium sp.]|uniref:flavodoxin n=1 Tax=Clostridium sp. DSM 8431 TaxID=1761781 RepID=UPI0008E2B836|nr:flavodoxin [Clostridium sp. DSM 8431]MCR4944702.1 flavodoxin [Clostridium sp.]SFU72802.1 Flavodoxin [Clostridium sp. DSM 8431]